MSGPIRTDRTKWHRFDPTADPTSPVASTPSASQNGHELSARTRNGGSSTAGRPQLPAALASSSVPGAWPIQFGGANEHGPTMPSIPVNQDNGFHASVEHPAIDHVPLPEHDLQWSLQLGADFIEGFTSRQLEHSFDSAFRRAEDATGKALLQHRPLPQSLGTQTGSAAPTGLMLAAKVKPRPAAMWKPTATVQRRVGIPANLTPMLTRFRAKVMAATDDEATAEEYVKTMGTMILWSFNTGRKFDTDNQADTDDLLRKFRAHVGENSDAGRNAGSALQALRTKTVTMAPARQLPGNFANPLAFTDAELNVIDTTTGGEAALTYASENWPALMEWLSRDQVFSVVSNKNGRSALQALEATGMSLAKPVAEDGLGLSVQQLVDIAKSDGGGPALEALTKIGPRLAKPVDQDGLGLSPEQLARLARNGGKPVLEALRDVGTTLHKMGMSADDMARLGGTSGKGPVLRAIADRSSEVLSGRLLIRALVRAGMKRGVGGKEVKAVKA